MHRRPRVAAQRLAADGEGGWRAEVHARGGHALPRVGHGHVVVAAPAREVVDVDARDRRRELVVARRQRARALQAPTRALPPEHRLGRWVPLVELALPAARERGDDDGDALISLPGAARKGERSSHKFR